MAAVTQKFPLMSGEGVYIAVIRIVLQAFHIIVGVILRRAGKILQSQTILDGDQEDPVLLQITPAPLQKRSVGIISLRK